MWTSISDQRRASAARPCSICTCSFESCLIGLYAIKSGASIGTIVESLTLAAKHQTRKAQSRKMPTVSTAGPTSRPQRSDLNVAFSVWSFAFS